MKDARRNEHASMSDDADGSGTPPAPNRTRARNAAWAAGTVIMITAATWFHVDALTSGPKARIRYKEAVLLGMVDSKSKVGAYFDLHGRLPATALEAGVASWPASAAPSPIRRVDWDPVRQEFVVETAVVGSAPADILRMKAHIRGGSLEWDCVAGQAEVAKLLAPYCKLP